MFPMWTNKAHDIAIDSVAINKALVVATLWVDAF